MKEDLTRSPSSLPSGPKRVLLLAVLLLTQVGNAAFSGTISTDNLEISAQDVTYDFTLSYTQRIPDDGKLVVRFPDNYTEPFDQLTCASISGFSVPAGADLDCEYLSSVRLLTITQGFPTTFTEVQFSVSGVTNPPYANETNYFKVESFYQSGGKYIPLESSTEFITLTPSAGSLSGETMTLENEVVGSYSVLTASLVTQHSIPKDGQIRIYFPKWNP
jgi:hypothetical protein